MVDQDVGAGKEVHYMRARLLTVILIVATLTAGIVLAGDETADSAKRADIKKLMDVTGSGKLGIQVMNQMIGAFKQGKMGVPDKFWEDFMAEINPNELVEMCIPSYEKHFTHAEIKQLLAFYETPLGQKLIRTQPELMQECMIAGQTWGRKLGEKVAKKLEAEGY